MTQDENYMLTTFYINADMSHSLTKYTMNVKCMPKLILHFVSAILYNVKN